MKSISLSLIAMIAMASMAFAANVIPGPEGGRLFDWKNQRLEFVIESDRKAKLLLYGADLKAKEPGEETLTVVAEAPSGKKEMALTRTKGGWITTAPFPEGKGYRIVIQARPNAKDKPTLFRLDLNTDLCGECKRAEYACNCAH